MRKRKLAAKSRTISRKHWRKETLQEWVSQERYTRAARATENEKEEEKERKKKLPGLPKWLF